MANKRISISKKNRFEVFKRDSFTCQYCGKSSPEVVLEVDHIKPVSKGGDNEIINLITSCFDCNRGKSDKELSDSSIVNKQQEQLAQLNERRNQIEMMMEWREELSNLDDELIELFCEEFTKETNATVLESGRAKISKWIKKYDFNLLLKALDKSASQYDDTEKIFDMIPRIAYFIVNPQPQYLTDLYYIRGIMRNRYSYVNNQMAMQLMKKAYEFGLSTDEIKYIALDSSNWTQFKNEILVILGDENGNV